MSTDGAAGGEAVEVASALGPVHCRWHAGAEPSAVIMVGGGDGGFDGPAEALYPTLAKDLNELGIGALRLDFRIHRFPGPIEDGVLDVCAGIGALARRGIERIGLLGHSFGGAVVIEAAAREPERVTSVATLASQTAGALRVGELAPRPILLVHGVDDTRLPAACSEMLFERAGEPRRLELLEGATHSLRQRREDVRRMLVEWFGRTLSTSD